MVWTKLMWLCGRWLRKNVSCWCHRVGLVPLGRSMKLGLVWIFRNCNLTVECVERFNLLMFRFFISKYCFDFLCDFCKLKFFAFSFDYYSVEKANYESLHSHICNIFLLSFEWKVFEVEISLLKLIIRHLVSQFTPSRLNWRIAWFHLWC